MTVCEDFINTAECAIQLNNDYNIKLLILVFFLLFAIAGFVWSYKINADKSTFNLLLIGYLRIGCGLYGLSFILMLLTLRNSMPMETFIFIVIGVYAVSFTVMIGATLLFAKEYIINLIGQENSNKFRERMKYKNEKD